jgi:hypothetical protein
MAMILVKPVIMKHPTVYKSSILAFVLLAATLRLSARPIDFSEISLLVRAGENESSIREEVEQRKLMHALTPQQESKLKSEGASDSLLRALRNPTVVIPKAEAAALDAAREQQVHSVRSVSEGSTASQTTQGKLYVIDVAIGHPINLSQWGGYDHEVAFYAYRCAGEDIIEPVMIDNYRTGSVVSRVIPTAGLSESEAFGQDSGPSRGWHQHQRFVSYESDSRRFTPYDARNDSTDDRFNFSDTVSVSSHFASRRLAIDWSNPVTVEGIPYVLYPVYGSGGVTLYYIAGSGSSVKLAVATQ